MFDQPAFIEAVASTAADWRDPEHEPRAEAVRATLAADNAFTEEAVAFAVNQQMALLTEEGLSDWLKGRHVEHRKSVGVLNAGNIPFVGLRDFLAVMLTGHRYLGTISSKSPSLLPAFVEDLRERRSSLAAAFDDTEAVFEAAYALIATGSDETLDWVRTECERHAVPAKRRLLRGHSFGVAVLGGNETDEDNERLAEDVLLHEGFGCRNVAVVWAPREHSPDRMLEAFARFRGVFPAHESTPGRLKMQQAFLEAVDQPHAFGEGLEFLVSRGDPEEQQPGHLRWTEYDDISEVNAWLDERASKIQLVAAVRDVRERLITAVDRIALGDAQRPGFDWCPDGVDTIEFLLRLDP